MAGQFGGMLIMLPCIYLMNKIDFTDVDNVFKLRVTYAVVHAAIFLAIGLVYLAIKKANDRRTISVPAVTAFGSPDATQPPTQSTVYEHDMTALKKLLQQNAMSCVISGFLHFKFGIVPPLFIQSVMNPYQTYQNPLVKLHLLGDRSPELVNRPWKQEANPLASLLGGGQQEPTAPAAAAAATVEEVTDETAPEAPAAQKKHSKKASAATKQLTAEEAEKTEEKLKVITPQLKEEERREHQLVESGEDEKVAADEAAPVIAAAPVGRARSNVSRAPPPVRLTPSPAPTPPPAEAPAAETNNTTNTHKGGKGKKGAKAAIASPAPASAVVAEEITPVPEPEPAAPAVAEEVAAPAEEPAVEVPASSKPEIRKKQKPRRDD